jgi:uncharacterized membrane protein
MAPAHKHIYRVAVAVSVGVVGLFLACLVFVWGGLRTTQVIDDVVLPLAPLGSLRGLCLDRCPPQRA